MAVTDPQIRVCTGKLFFLISQPKHVVGTQKNCLDDTVLLSTQNTCIKINANLGAQTILIWAYELWL